MGAYNFDVVQLYDPANFMGGMEVTDAMKDTGWFGGLWVKYAYSKSWQDANNIRVKRTVEKATPNSPIGFIVRGSLEGSDQFTGQYPGRTGVISVCNQGQFLFRFFENLTYTLNQNLYVSSNGILTNIDETGIARVVALCSGLPADNNGYLAADVLFP
jgi:hypothetical protein